MPSSNSKISFSLRRKCSTLEFTLPTLKGCAEILVSFDILADYQGFITNLPNLLVAQQVLTILSTNFSTSL